MKLPSRKGILAWFILFSLACGPMVNLQEYFSIVAPETTSHPKATEPYFFSHEYFYLSESHTSESSEELAKKANIESWRNYTKQQISVEIIEKGLYTKNSGEEFANHLESVGKNQAAKYVLRAQEIDRQVMQFREFWEPEIELDTVFLMEKREQFRQEIIHSSTDDFLKERYTFQVLKIDGRLRDWALLLDDYESLNQEYRSKTYIDEWSRAWAAGARLHLGQNAEGIFEFAQLFATSPTRRYQADLSVRRLENPDFEKAAALASTDSEKGNVWALQAIQPFQDGLPLMEKIAKVDPNHPMLELIMSREINKNEVGFYAEKNSWYVDVFDSNYRTDKQKVDSLRNTAKSYFDKLSAFNTALLSDTDLHDKGFWFFTSAYLNFIAHAPKACAAMLEKARQASTENRRMLKQIDFLETVLFLYENGLKKETRLMQKVKQFVQKNEIEDFRDNNLNIYLAEALETAYLKEDQTKEIHQGPFFSCSKKREKVSIGQVKAFLAKNMAAQTTYRFDQSYWKSGVIDDTPYNILEQTVAFMESDGLKEEDETLISLAQINVSDLWLAIGRHYVCFNEYAKAVNAFSKCESGTFANPPFQSYFLNMPDLFIKSKIKEDYPEDALDYLKKVAEWQNTVAEQPENAEAWYNLGLAAYNLSYFGNAWILAQRGWSVGDLRYDRSDSDYFTNGFAKICLQHALEAKPDQELGAKISYIGALVERNQYTLALIEGEPRSYSSEGDKNYLDRMEREVKPKFSYFFKQLHEEYNQAEYEKMIIRECLSYQAYLESKNP
ncbi:hypothetical protein LAG90_13770 [Marinilongibacter aquaticus]|uniref:hypothetical protein n=1 Tax=Marinilongibacter aquaticus TaxID=2975157 RepID=UPI0021BDA23F|nr:hypothetical protein [Marinilongibacter aquaticus]UBM57873.1 hypothetical protein LAG90_13770 [Marinilongibacter aquaticus]